MGSHHKKKKGTTDTRIIIADIKKEEEEAIIETVIHQYPDFDTTVPEVRTQVDFVNVVETIDPSQG
jgi:hypothetical protein